MADYYRNIHLLFLKGKSGSELSHSPQLKENYKKMSWKHDFIYKLFETFYINYTVGQEAWTPKFQHMMNIIDMPWLYFVFELTVLNSMLLYMIKKHEHICEDFSKQL